MQQDFDWLRDFDISRTIGGLALLKVQYIGNELATNILDSAIKYLKEYEEEKDRPTSPPQGGFFMQI